MPDFSVKANRRIIAWTVSLRSAFKEILADKSCTPKWEVLNLPGVSGSERTSNESRPRLIKTELIRKSRFIGSFKVSFEAKASNTNWKLGIDSGVSFRNWISKPINWTLLTTILPFSKGISSNRAERRRTFSISSPLRSSSWTSSICKRLNNPTLIWPTETSVFRSFFNSIETVDANFSWTDGMFRSTNTLSWRAKSPQTKMRTIYFIRLLRTIIMQKYKYRTKSTSFLKYNFHPFHRKNPPKQHINCISKREILHKDKKYAK